MSLFHDILSLLLLWFPATMAWSRNGMGSEKYGDQLSRRVLMEFIPANVAMASLAMIHNPFPCLADDTSLEPPQALVTGDAKKVSPLQSENPQSKEKFL